MNLDKVENYVWKKFCAYFVQENGLGALSVMLVDMVCRREVLLAEPGLKTLLALCVDQPGYEGEWAARRRIDSAKALCLVLQRDPELRLSLIQSGGTCCKMHSWI